jgi:hypothetical protein
MEDGGFEIEVVRDEASASDLLEFQFDAAENLDLFYQPELTAEESAQGAVRLENVIGSYAVCHEKKANHRVGGTNYAADRGFQSPACAALPPWPTCHARSSSPTCNLCN